jgi:adenine-specific DNA-methyltransferase
VGGNRVEQYIHDEEKRLNNPPVGLVTAETDRINGKKRYNFDTHLEPALQWAGKTEGASFEVDTVSLHVHERIDPQTLIQAMRRKQLREQQTLVGYFETTENNPPIREAIEFYKHAQGWSNRLIAGDSLLVMNSLLEKEGFEGKVQMVYIDPPYGIRYASNFQPFIGKRDVEERDEDLTQEPETIKAFRDSWELGIHSYLTYLRDRFILAQSLLTPSGSCFVQISDENLHHVKELMDEVFGHENFVRIIGFQTTSGLGSKYLKGVYDFILWYAKDVNQMKYRQLYIEKPVGQETYYDKVQLPNGEVVDVASSKRLPENARFLTYQPLLSGAYRPNTTFEFEFNGRKYHPGANRCWKTTIDGMNRLAKAGRIYASENTLKFIRYFDDFPVTEISNLWSDTMQLLSKVYAVQTVSKVIERCMLMTTDPGDLVFDPTCGSGTTAYAGEKWGRRWITCDTSRVAITLAKQRIMTALYDYYQLSDSSDGVSKGFIYEKVPHITLSSIANGEEEETAEETLFDKPVIDKTKKRVSGPFTVEAVPAQRVRSFEEVDDMQAHPDLSIARSGETSRLDEWTSELLSTGIRGRDGHTLEFASVEILGGTKWIHAGAETKDGKRAVVSFGPEYAPLEQRQVELGIEEAQELVPRPKLVIFAAFQFDPEAAKDIDALKWPGVDVLKAQMNADLFTRDLKKNRSSNESFWLVGQPDVELRKIGEKYQVIVTGFDYYNTRTGSVESGDISKIAMWEVDTDYDGRSLYPRQVFFPLAGANDGWNRLARTLNTLIDEEVAETYRGNKSVPFAAGENKQVAVKIIDNRGIESLRVIKVRD